MTNINHADREHSIWSPSAWNMWSNCPASALATADMPREDSEASLRGTYLHEVAEAMYNHKGWDESSRFNTPDNIDQAKLAVQTVLDEAKKMGEDTQVFLEQKVNLEEYGHEDVGGTGDILLFNPTTQHLHIIDYKFGNTPVKVKDNGQLSIYAAAATGWLFGEIDREVDTVSISIIQPVTRNVIDTIEMTYSDLQSWSLYTLVPAIVASKDPLAPFIPGDKQCQWCPLSGSCDAQKKEVMDAFDAYDEAKPLESELEGLLPKLDLMEVFIKATRIKALKSLEKGDSIGGYKLVRQIKHRKWADVEKAEKWLAARKIPKDERTVTKVISIAQAEKKLKEVLTDNKILTRNFNALIDRPTGGLTMAKADDRREAITVEPDPIGDDFII